MPQNKSDTGEDRIAGKRKTKTTDNNASFVKGDAATDTCKGMDLDENSTLIQ